MGMLKLALERGRFDLAAHILVYGLVVANSTNQEKDNGEKRTKRVKPEGRGFLR